MVEIGHLVRRLIALAGVRPLRVGRIDGVMPAVMRFFRNQGDVDEYRNFGDSAASARRTGHLYRRAHIIMPASGAGTRTRRRISSLTEPFPVR